MHSTICHWVNVTLHVRMIDHANNIGISGPPQMCGFPKINLYNCERIHVSDKITH